MDHTIPLPKGSGYLSNQMSYGSEPGLQTCSWRLEAMTGQQIQVTQINFNWNIAEAPTEPLG